jgi:hypothetical protein
MTDIEVIKRFLKIAARLNICITRNNEDVWPYELLEDELINLFLHVEKTRKGESDDRT